MTRLRVRPLDLALLAIAAVMVAATATEVHRVYILRARAPIDRHAFGVYLHARGEPGRDFAPPQLVRGVGRADLECATRRPVLSSGWRLCLFLRRSGPLSDRVLGGFHRSTVSTGPASRTHCFGRAARAGLCALSRPPSAPSGGSSRPHGGPV